MGLRKPKRKTAGMAGLQTDLCFGLLSQWSQNGAQWQVALLGRLGLTRDTVGGAADEAGAGITWGRATMCSWPVTKQNR